MSKERLVLCFPAEDRHLRQIRAAAPDHEIVDAGQEQVAEEILAADIYCGHAKVPIDWRRVVDGGRLRWIQSSAAGLDHCLTAPVIDSSIVVTSASGVLSDQVAEHTLGLVIATQRNFVTFWEAKKRKEFIRRPTRDVTHSTVGIVGFGGVGRRMAEVFAPLAGRIVAVDLFPVDKPACVDQLWPPEQLDALLAASDVVILCLPLTPQTTGLFNAETIAKMKPGAVLVNVARGPIVEENALADALASKHLAAAAIDVAPQEPLPPTSRLWDAPNLIITPHVAGQSARRIDNMTNFFCENLRRWRAGETLMNLVDKELGFPRRESN